MSRRESAWERCARRLQARRGARLRARPASRGPRARTRQVGEDAGELAEDAEVDLNALFADLTFDEAEELALSASRPLSEARPVGLAPARQRSSMSGLLNMWQSARSVTCGSACTAARGCCYATGEADCFSADARCRPLLPITARWCVQVRQLRWRAGASLSGNEQPAPPARFVRRAGLACRRGCSGGPLTVRLQPMEIRTFRLTAVRTR